MATTSTFVASTVSTFVACASNGNFAFSVAVSREISDKGKVKYKYGKFSPDAKWAKEQFDKGIRPATIEEALSAIIPCHNVGLKLPKDATVECRMEWENLNFRGFVAATMLSYMFNVPCPKIENADDEKTMLSMLDEKRPAISEKYRKEHNLAVPA